MPLEDRISDLVCLPKPVLRFDNRCGFFIFFLLHSAAFLYVYSLRAMYSASVRFPNVWVRYCASRLKFERHLARREWFMAPERGLSVKLNIKAAGVRNIRNTQRSGVGGGGRRCRCFLLVLRLNNHNKNGRNACRLEPHARAAPRSLG